MPAIFSLSGSLVAANRFKRKCHARLEEHVLEQTTQECPAIIGTPLWRQLQQNPELKCKIKLETTRLLKRDNTPANGGYRTHVTKSFRDGAVVLRAHRKRTADQPAACYEYFMKQEEFTYLHKLSSKLSTEARLVGAKSTFMTPLMTELRNSLDQLNTPILLRPHQDENCLPVHSVFPVKGWVLRRCCAKQRPCAQHAADISDVLSLYVDGRFHSHWVKTKMFERAELLANAVQNLVKALRLPASKLPLVCSAPKGTAMKNGVIALHGSSFDRQLPLRKAVTLPKARGVFAELYELLPKLDGYVVSAHFLCLALATVKAFMPSCKERLDIEVAQDELRIFCAEGRGYPHFCHALTRWAGLHMSRPSEADVCSFLHEARDAYLKLASDTAFIDELARRHVSVFAKPSSQHLPKMEFHTLAPPIKPPHVHANLTGLQELVTTVPSSLTSVFTDAKEQYMDNCRNGHNLACPVMESTLDGEMEAQFPIKSQVQAGVLYLHLKGMTGTVVGYCHGKVRVAFGPPLGDLPIPPEHLHNADPPKTGLSSIMVLSKLKKWGTSTRRDLYEAQEDALLESSVVA